MKSHGNALRQFYTGKALAYRIGCKVATLSIKLRSFRHDGKNANIPFPRHSTNDLDFRRATQEL